MEFHQMSADDVLAHFSTNLDGLSSDEVADRQAQFGKNKIPQIKARSLAEIFLRQFLSPLIYILIAAGVLSVFTGNVHDAIFITIIIMFNAILGTYQEWRAEDSARALRVMVQTMARVKRGGKIEKINSEDLVAGDIVLLESGDKLPADMRLIEAKNLFIEEAALTGESTAVEKNTDALKENVEYSIGDRINMAFAATLVQKGRGLGVVTSIAENTQIGAIADSLRNTAVQPPPLVKRMEVFSKLISIVVLVFCVALGFLAYYRGLPSVEVLFLMVALGVSAIPEGLPVALTVALARGTRRMAKRNVIVRKLAAVEGLGSCTVIASDKTGTLTLDQQSIAQLYLPDGRILEVTGNGASGEGSILENEVAMTIDDSVLSQLILAGVVSNEAILRKTASGWENSGDAVDVAFRSLAYKIGQKPQFFLDQIKLEKLIPYESENKYSAAYYRMGDQLYYVAKGAFETIASHISETERKPLSEKAEEMAANGYRVMALAGAKVTDMGPLPELHLLGLVGIIDPLRPEAKAAVNDCFGAGIEVLMVTGDHPATALHIARSLQIADNKDQVITGVELQAFGELSTEEWSQKIRNKKVFARVSPIQKKMIVDALKAMGHYVAVTGDGANDAPALKSAHIGIAMGAGTDLAKDASSIIVIDNNFASISAAVQEGRFTYDNLRKIIYMLISTGAAELLAIAVAIIFNVPLPFLAVQLLWLNLVTNGIQDIGLAFEKGDPDVMNKPPRNPEENVFNKLMNTQVILSAVVIAALIFGIWQYLIYTLGYEEAHARTIVVALMVLLQNFHVLNCRSERKSIFRIPFKNNYVLIGGIILAQLLHFSAPYIPGLNTVLQLRPITLAEWVKLIPTAMIIVVVMEIFKWWWRTQEKRKL